MDELLLLLGDDSDEASYTPGVDRLALEDGAGILLLEDSATDGILLE